jgi:hypothetical protein
LVCANAVVRAQEPSQSDNYTASMLQICRQYANATAQTGMPADLMFQQCKLNGIARSLLARQAIGVNRLGR